jgi:hypothetical protein
VPRSGEHCIQPGLYAPECGTEFAVLLLVAGDEFPMCPHCQCTVVFTFVR